MEMNTLCILDVGHGNCAILKDINGIVVIDVGLGSSLLEFLKDNELDEIDVILISHADADHIGGLLNILSNDIKVGKIRLNTDSLKKSPAWDDLLKVLNDYDNEGKVDFDIGLAANSNENFDQGEIHIEILGPSKYLAGRGPGSKDRSGRNITSNSTSAVIRLVRDGEPIALFTGDIDEVGLDEIIYNNVELLSPILVFPHHGGRIPSKKETDYTLQICELVKPQMVLFSIGRGKHGTPREDIVKAIKNYSRDIRLVCTQLSKNCADEVPNITPTHLSRLFAKGKEQNKCCAGTVTIELCDLNRIIPTVENHEKFIKENIDSPLCQYLT